MVEIKISSLLNASDISLSYLYQCELSGSGWGVNRETNRPQKGNN